MHNKVQAGICVRTGGQAGRYDYYPSFDSSVLYGIINFIFYEVLVGRNPKNSKTKKRTKKEGGRGHKRISSRVRTYKIHT